MTEDERRARMERALLWAGPTHTLADVAARIKAGKAQYWTNGDGQVVTEIYEYPLMKTINYWLVAGELKACLALEDEINAFGRREGCEIATATARPSWTGVGKRIGWRPHAQVFWKPLVEKEFCK